MPGDESGKNEEELLSQIDDLRERMDRLMKGGTSTSNSALLTDSPRQTVRTVGSGPAPERTRVRDLIGPTDREVLETHTGGEEVVEFPEADISDDDGKAGSQTPRAHGQRPPTAATPGKPNVSSAGGSLISVPPGGRSEARRPVTSFDDLGSAVEEELARDASVPPAEPRKGPGLASRFGSADEPVPVAEPARTVDEEEQGEVEVETAVLEDGGSDVPEASGGRRSALVAIWGFTALSGGTIAVLHLAGVI